MKIKYLNFPLIYMLGIFLVLLHVFFLIIGNYYNYQVWWADIFLHASGGFLAGMFVLWFLFNRSAPDFPKEKIPNFLIAMSALAFAALLGVLWEFYEFALDKITGYKSYSITVLEQNMADTMSDLFFDLLGALMSNIFLIFKNKNKEAAN